MKDRVIDAINGTVLFDEAGGGPRVEGYHDVRDSWKEILSAGALQIRVVPVHRVEGVMVSVHNIVEQVMMSSSRGEPHVVQVNATNVYHKGPNGWKIVMHHASPAMDSEEMVEDDLSDGEDQEEGADRLHEELR